MNKEPIDFKQKRDAGEMLGIAFAFFFKEIKGLYKPLLFYVLPFFIISGIVQMSLNINDDIFNRVNYEFNSQMVLVNFLNFISFIMLYTVIGSYIKLYVTYGKGNFDEKDVWKNVSEYFGKVALGQFLYGLMIIFGLFMLIIPAIYLLVVSVFIHFIIIFENKTAGKAIERSFVVIKNNWWATFGMLIVLIVIFLTLAVFISTILYFISAGNNSVYSYIGVLIDNVFLISIVSVFEIFIALLYFKYVEEKEQNVLYDKINKISEGYDIKGEGISYEEINKYDEDDNVIPDRDDEDRFKPKY